ncbi:MAG: AIM24 family protein [Deltaproteobacteria bacterium]|nr:AIM24 family protein [Deltaproteobacteria bacterium]
MSSFRVNSDRLLEISLQNEKVMTVAGSMVAYVGSMKFEKAILGGEGLLGAFKRKVTGEGLSLMTVTGSGVLYCAQNASELAVLELSGEKLFVESSGILAYDTTLSTNTAFAGLRGASSGQGLFTTTIQGKGNVALLAKGGLIGLEVTPDNSLCVDPQAFVGYKGNIQQEFVFDVSWRTMVGQASGESYQLKFTGQGQVFIQSAERS